MFARRQASSSWYGLSSATSASPTTGNTETTPESRDDAVSQPTLGCDRFKGSGVCQPLQGFAVSLGYSLCYRQLLGESRSSLSFSSRSAQQRVSRSSGIFAWAFILITPRLLV